MINSMSSPKLVLHVYMNIHDLIKSQKALLYCSLQFLSLQWLNLSLDLLNSADKFIENP